MLFDMLIIFVLVAIICFFVTLFIIEERPVLSIPFIMIGMIFSILCTYGFWDVEFFYTGYNASVGNTTSYIYSTVEYGDPYSYVFVVLFYIYILLFVRAGWNMWEEALQTKGEMNYSLKNKRRR